MKGIMKRIGCLAAAALLLLCISAAVSRAAGAQFVLYLQDGEGGRLNTSDWVESWYRSDERRYFFLPAHYHLDQLHIFFTGADTVTIQGVSYKSGDPISLPLDRDLSVRAPGVYPFTLRVMQSENIPALFIDTESGSMRAVHSKKGVREAGTLYMADADGTVEYDGGLRYIRARGNSTFDYPKKPYQIQLETGVSLCGMSKNKTYILLANYLDRSEIRNTIALDLARYSGAYAFTPVCQSVDLYLNHSYAGTYLLTEKCEIGKNRLNITDLEEETEKLNEKDLSSYPVAGNSLYMAGASRASVIPNEPEDCTGGYLILANNADYFAQEATGFVTRRGQAFTMQQPKYATQRQIKYISSVMQEIENGLFSPDGRDPDTGRHFSELLDMKSFVNRYLQAEITNDYDGQRPYFYKDSDAVDGKVYCGPVWDQDNIFGANTVRVKPRAIWLETDTHRQYYWFTQAMKHASFRKQMIKTYYAVYRPALQILLGKARDDTGTLLSIDEYAARVHASGEMDHVRWPATLWAEYQAFNVDASGTMDECAEYLKWYVRERMEGMDAAYPRK